MLLRNVFFFFHMVGLVMLASATLGAPLADQALWGGVESTSPLPGQVLSSLRMSQRFGKMAELGALLMLLTGIGMLWATQWIFWGQMWLYVKLAIFVLMGITGGAIAAPTKRRLMEILAPRLQTVGSAVVPMGSEGELAVLKGKLQLFDIGQAVLFGIIIFLAVFKP